MGKASKYGWDVLNISYVVGNCQHRWPIHTILSPIGNRKHPLQKGSFAKASGGETTGTIAFRCGGASAAANHCVWPIYDPPAIPTLPSHQGCAATHSTVS